MSGLSILRIDAAMRGNKVIYWLGRVPLVRRLVSDTLYGAKEGKLALSAVLWVWRGIKSLVTTALYVGLLCLLPLLIVYEPERISEAFGSFCWILFFMSFVAGALLNPVSVAPSPLKYTCVRMMGMDARVFHRSAQIKDMAEYALTFAVALMLSCALLGQSPVAGLLLTGELLCARLCFDRLHLWIYHRRGSSVYGKVGFTLAVIFAAVAAAYVPALVFAVPGQVLISWPAAVIFLGMGAFALYSLASYKSYYRATLDTCTADRVSPQVAKEKNAGAAFKDVQLRDSDLTSEGECGRLSGWPYLQALFFRRHSRMMYKPVKYVLIILAVITAAGGAFLLLFRSLGWGELFSKVTAILPYLVFVLYVVDNNILGNRITKAMFYNCDLAMLKYGWYREPAVVLKNFVLRFRRMCLVNLVISGALCLCVTVLTLCAGGRPPLGEYIAFLVALLCLGVFFAVHGLGMYYLFQPYTSDLQMKNPFFSIINTVMYVLCYTCIQIRSTPGWFTPMVLAVTVVYSGVILLLVRRRSPRTFRVK